MGLTGINSNNFNTTIAIYRTGFTASDVGDFDESQALIEDSLPAIIQPKQSDLIFDIQGVDRIQTHACYLASGSGILVEDIIKDNTTGTKYTVVSVEDFKLANSSVSGTHHTRLSLESIGAGPDTATKSTVTSKTHIHS